MKQKFTQTIALLFIICSMAQTQPVQNKKPLFKLPQLFRELEQPPSQLLMQTNPVLYQHLMERRALLSGLLQKQVAQNLLPKEALAVLDQQRLSLLQASPASKVGGVTATDFHLTKDINTAKNSYPNNYNYTYANKYAVLSNIVYYAADNGINGIELWRSDGTAAGTYLVKDVEPGTGSGNPQNITTYNNKLYFNAFNSTTGWELWQSDGTDAGTMLLKDLNPGNGNSFPNRFTLANGSLFFVATDPTSYSYDNQLWKTDGTAAGTALVSNLAISGYDANGIGQLTAAAGQLFFTANSYITGRELWRSDGTASGTYFIKDINPNNNYDYYGGNTEGPVNLTSYNNKLYFSAAGSNRLLWQSDGTYYGTTEALYNNAVNIINDNYYAAQYQDIPFPIAQNSLFFMAYTYATGIELYKYNATNTGGVSLVKDIAPGTISSSITTSGIRSMNDTIYFVAPDFSNTYSLWKSAGTSLNTNILKTLPDMVSPYNFAVAGKALYFAVNNGTNGTEPWISNGTASGTKLLKDVNTGNIGSSPAMFTLCNGNVYFTAFTASNGFELWNTLGTGATTKLVVDANTTTTTDGLANYNYFVLQALDSNNVIFRGNTYSTGSEPWRSDGSAVGTKQIKEIAAGEASNYPQIYASKNGKAYFSGFDEITGSSSGSFGSESMYMTNGTTAGTKRIGSSHQFIYNAAVAENGNVFYLATIQGSSFSELWCTDSLGNNRLLNNTVYNTYKLGIAGNLCFFEASNSYGYELWVSDGTFKGTKMIADLTAGVGSSFPGEFQTIGNYVVFSAYDAAFNPYLYSSDGTTAGTKLIKAISPYLYYGTCVSKSKLYFSAYDAVNGIELWSTDGTAANTVLVKDINTGTASSSPQNLTEVNGIVCFSAFDATYGYELWKSTGTTAGTKLIKDLTTGSESSYYLDNFTSAGGKLYFTDSALLWVSDGTAAGTKKVIDPNLATVTNIPYMLGTGNKLFFAGYSNANGYELYEGNATLSAFAPVAKTQNSLVINNVNTLTASVSPNPAINSTTIKLTNTTGNISIMITDLNGKTLWQTNTSSNIMNIDVSRYAAGTYIVIVKDEKETRTMKLIKE